MSNNTQNFATSTSSTTTSSSNIPPPEATQTSAGKSSNSAFKNASSSPSSAKDPSTERIITHMNADHPDSISRYLSAFSNVQPWETLNARLETLTPSSLSIRTNSIFSDPKTHTIALDPPMASLSEARERLIALDRTAAQKLGRDPVTLKRYVGPQSAGVWAWVMFVTGAWVLNARQAHGRWVGEELLGSQAVAGFLMRAQPFVLGTMLVLHVLEAVMVSKQMDKYSVIPGSRLWWKWVGAVFLEGFTAFGRFRGEVAEERKKVEGKKH